MSRNVQRSLFIRVFRARRFGGRACDRGYDAIWRRQGGDGPRPDRGSRDGRDRLVGWGHTSRMTEARRASSGRAVPSRKLGAAKP